MVEELKQRVERVEKGSWLEWRGGRNPVKKNILVEVRFRNGEKCVSLSQQVACWKYDNDYDNGAWDVMAYRIIAGTTCSKCVRDEDKVVTLTAQLEEAREALKTIAYGDATEWINCSSREVAKAALKQKENKA